MVSLWALPSTCLATKECHVGTTRRTTTTTRMTSHKRLAGPSNTFHVPNVVSMSTANVSAPVEPNLVHNIGTARNVRKMPSPTSPLDHLQSTSNVPAALCILSPTVLPTSKQKSTTSAPQHLLLRKVLIERVMMPTVTLPCRPNDSIFAPVAVLIVTETNHTLLTLTFHVESLEEELERSTTPVLTAHLGIRALPPHSNMPLSNFLETFSLPMPAWPSPTPTTTPTLLMHSTGLASTRSKPNHVLAYRLLVRKVNSK